MSLPGVITIDLADVDDQTWKRGANHTTRHTYGLSHHKIRAVVNAFATQHIGRRIGVISERSSIVAKALYGLTAVAMLAGIGSFVVGFMAMGLNLVILVSLPSYWLAKRFAHPGAEEVLKHDKRAPILYLRSFADERSYNAFVSSNLKTLENTVSEYFTHERFIGHLIAIGEPGGSNTVFGEGASRAFVPDAAWQQPILSWMQAARMIIMVPFATEGVRWELQQVFEKGHLKKLLILLPLASRSGARLYDETPKEKERRWQALEKSLAATPFTSPLRNVDFEHVLAIHFRPNGGAVVLRGEPRAHVADKWDVLYEQVLDVAFYGMFCGDWDREVGTFAAN